MASAHPFSHQELAEWRETRRYLNHHRDELALLAARLYPGHAKLGTGGLLTRHTWAPSSPLLLAAVSLAWQDTPPPTRVTGTEPVSAGVRPLRAPGERYASYADALAALDRPGTFENRECYRLTGIAPSHDGLELTFCPGRYFDVVNISEAVAHELAAAHRAGNQSPTLDDLPLRALIGDPCDLAARPLLPALSVLTVRRDLRSRRSTFILHWRDPAKVAHGGGLYQVMPVGMFQPSHDASWNRRNDFDLWRSMVREYAEEFLGVAEDYDTEHRPLNYEAWPLYQALTAARTDGRLRLYYLGLGVDPLSLVTDLLIVAVFDADVFDRVFAGLVTTNDEGRVVKADPAAPGTGGAEAVGLPFTEASVRRCARLGMQAAGVALIEGALGLTQ